MTMYLSKRKAAAFSVWFLKDAIMLPLTASRAPVTHWIIAVKPYRNGLFSSYKSLGNNLSPPPTFLLGLHKETGYRVGLVLISRKLGFSNSAAHGFLLQ